MQECIRPNPELRLSARDNSWPIVLVNTVGGRETASVGEQELVLEDCSQPMSRLEDLRQQLFWVHTGLRTYHYSSLAKLQQIPGLALVHRKIWVSAVLGIDGRAYCGDASAHWE